MKHENLRNMLHRELSEIEHQGKLTSDTLCQVYQITGALHRLDEIEEYEDGYLEDYSGRRSYSSNRNSSRNSSNDGYLRNEISNMMAESDSDREREAYRNVLRKMGG